MGINMLSQDRQSYSNKVDIISKLVSNFKQMYMMAKDKKAPISLLAELVSKGFKYGFNGYWLALVKKDIENMNTFKLECEKLAKAGEQIAKIVEGKDSESTKCWRDKNQNFEDWCRRYIKGNL